MDAGRARGVEPFAARWKRLLEAQDPVTRAWFEAARPQREADGALFVEVTSRTALEVLARRKDAVLERVRNIDRAFPEIAFVPA